MKYIFYIFFYFIVNYNLLCQITNAWSNPINITILNSEKDDYAPQYNRFTNQVFFNSERLGYSFFYITNYQNETFSEPVFLKYPINKQRNNQNYISFIDENIAYYTSFRRTKTYPKFSIYKSNYTKNNWLDGYIDDTLNINDNNFQLTISPDGSSAVFVGNRDDYPEDTDLWYITKDEFGNWETPIKLDEINTIGREITPFLKSNDTLYFASDGYGGPGGFDIYVTIKRNNKWQRPTPLFHINTEFNESDLIFLPDGSIIFASDRPGGAGGLDLYHSKLIKSQKEQINIEKPEIAILTQTSTINVESNIEAYLMPFPVYFPIEFFYEKSNSFIYRYLENALDSLLHRMSKEENTILQVTNSPYNNIFRSFFETYQLNLNRLIFTGEPNNFITINSNNPKILEPIEITTQINSLRPQALDILIEGTNLINIKNHKLILKLDNIETEIAIPSNELPVRFYYDLEPFTNLIVNSDSMMLSFVAELVDNSKINYNKKFNIIKNESKTFIQNKNNERYIEFYFFAQNKLELNNIIANSQKLIELIKDEMDISKKVTIEYWDNNNQSTANDLKNIIATRKTFIEVLQSKDKSINSNLLKKLLRLRIIKF